MSRQGRAQTAVRAVVLTVAALAAFLWGPAGCSKPKPAPPAASAPADKGAGGAAASPSSRPAPPWVSDAENDFLPAPARYPDGGAPGR